MITVGETAGDHLPSTTADDSRSDDDDDVDDDRSDRRRGLTSREREITRDVGDPQGGQGRRRRGRSIGRSRQTSPASQGIAARGIAASRAYAVDARTMGRRGVVSSSRAVRAEGTRPRERAVTCHLSLAPQMQTTGRRGRSASGLPKQRELSGERNAARDIYCQY